MTDTEKLKKVAERMGYDVAVVRGVVCCRNSNDELIEFNPKAPPRIVECIEWLADNDFDGLLYAVLFYRTRHNALADAVINAIAGEDNEQTKGGE